jgi:hypothetical protein
MENAFWDEPRMGPDGRELEEEQDGTARRGSASSTSWKKEILDGERSSPSSPIAHPPSRIARVLERTKADAL